MTDWQPIETAPKDGRTILIFDGREVRMGNWCYLLYDSVVNGRPVKAYGWGESNTMLAEIRDATHWMPIPPPPQS